MKTLIIAEAGVNHNSDINIAFDLVDAAAKCGADVVKFQAALPSEVVTKTGKMADYQIKNLGSNDSQLEMTKRMHLKLDCFKEISEYTQSKGIQFACTSFGNTATETLSKLNMPFWKIPSGEITNLPYLRKIASFHKPIIISTGMSYLGEIESAIKILEEEGILKSQISVLHCTTDYPASFEDVNLRAMTSIKKAFKINVGYSDHTIGIEVPIAAVALGANIIEKHLTLDKNMIGPDHKASIEPKEFSKMVESIRNIESALGNGVKKPTKNELKNIPIVRRSIVASEFIKKGTVFSKTNLTVKRPFKGKSPMEWDNLIGKTAKKDFAVDEFIE